jgi:hypothetical protein
MEVTMVPAIRKGPVHLRFDGGKVLISPEDSRRFSMAANRAVRVLQQEKEREEVLRQFNNHYLPFLYEWCRRHAPKVRACYLGMPTPNGLTVFIVSEDKYDFCLGDEIAKFGIQLEQEGWSSNILQIPDGDEDDMLTFFNPETSLEVYAEPEAAPGKGRSQQQLSQDHPG